MGSHESGDTKVGPPSLADEEAVKRVLVESVLGLGRREQSDAAPAVAA